MTKLSVANPILEIPNGFRVFIYEWERTVTWDELIEIYILYKSQEEPIQTFDTVLRDFAAIPLDGVELKMAYDVATRLTVLVFPKLKGIMG